MGIRFADILAGFDDPATAAVLLAPEIAARAEKEGKRNLQRHPATDPDRGRGRPRLLPEQAAESKLRLRAVQAAWIAAKRAKLKESKIK
jgi:hypothetical protein